MSSFDIIIPGIVSKIIRRFEGVVSKDSFTYSLPFVSVGIVSSFFFRTFSDFPSPPLMYLNGIALKSTWFG